MLSTSVAGRRSCLASSLRSSRAERGSGARIATGRPSRDARGRERITGGSSPPQSSRGFIALALPSWFSRPVAGRRSCLASSLSSPFRAERGSGARIATGNVRATHAARMHPGWFLTAAIDQGGLVRCCVCESAVSSSRPRSSIRARRSLAPLPAPAAGGRGAPTSGRARRVVRGARSAGARGSARLALSVSPRSPNPCCLGRGTTQVRAVAAPRRPRRVACSCARSGAARCSCGVQSARARSRSSSGRRGSTEKPCRVPRVRRQVASCLFFARRSAPCEPPPARAYRDRRRPRGADAGTWAER